MTADVRYGQPLPTMYAGITRQTVSVNGRSTWGSRLECECGAERVALAGSSVSYEDGPYHFARGHDCPLYVGTSDYCGRSTGRRLRAEDAS